MNKNYFVKDIIEDISMGPFGSDIKTDCFVEDGFPLLDGSNLTGLSLNEDKFKYVTYEKALSLKKAIAKRGDIVVTYRGTLGQISYIPDNSLYHEYLISQSQFRFTVNKSIVNPIYLT